MKKLIIIVIALVLVVLASYSGLSAISQKLDAEAEKTILVYEAKLKEFKTLNGKYPESLGEVKISREKLLFFINPSPILYTKNNDIELYYIQFPLGPKHVYNLSNMAWRFEE